MCKMTFGGLRFGSMALSGALDKNLRSFKGVKAMRVCVCFNWEAAGFRVNWLKQENRT